MKGHKFLSILIACLMILLGSGVTSAGAESGKNPDLTIKASFIEGDSDDDGIDDATELMLARKYSPYLIFDEDEQESVDTIMQLHQVSPIIHHSGKEGAILVYVFLYDMDYGADFDRGWSDWFTDPIDSAAGLIMDPFDQFFGKHCGDTEAIYFFVSNNGNWTNTRLESIYWKRHYDPFYETSEDAVVYKDLNDGFGATHPVIYVSEDKHAMYPSHDMCEDYETDVVQEKLESAAGYLVPGILEDFIYIPVTPKMEDCSGGQERYTDVTFAYNVGEAKSNSTMNRNVLNGSIYAGYDPWDNVEFLGRTDNVKFCDSAAGGIGGKWCGNPYPSSKEHPCDSDNWWFSASSSTSSSGICMNANTDRYGSDYYNFLLDGYDATPCMQACVNDPNCVSYSFVLPGNQGGDKAVCYLKNAAPEEYYNDQCISGLRSDCVN
ncbi:MAG: PAN domain-containing protein [Anaerolineales bacterium]|nr:PAN domain-containing protein [Anaerolineales bacterium]